MSSADLGPPEGSRIGVPCLDGGGDRGLGLSGRAVCAAPDLIVGRQGEEPLDLIDPGCRGGCGVWMPTRASGEPVADQLGLVAGRVVHDDVRAEVGRGVLLDHAGEPTTLGGAMACHALAEDDPGLDVEGCEQRRRAMPCVVVAPAFRLPMSRALTSSGSVDGLRSRVAPQVSAAVIQIIMSIPAPPRRPPSTVPVAVVASSTHVPATLSPDASGWRSSCFIPAAAPPPPFSLAGSAAAAPAARPRAAGRCGRC